MIFGVGNLAYVVVGVLCVGHRIAKFDLLAVRIFDNRVCIVFRVGNMCRHLGDQTIACKQNRFDVFGIVLRHVVEDLHILRTEFEEDIDDKSVTLIVCGMIVSLVERACECGFVRRIAARKCLFVLCDLCVELCLDFSLGDGCAVADHAFKSCNEQRLILSIEIVVVALFNTLFVEIVFEVVFHL